MANKLFSGLSFNEIPVTIRDFLLSTVEQGAGNEWISHMEHTSILEAIDDSASATMRLEQFDNFSSEATGKYGKALTLGGNSTEVFNFADQQVLGTMDADTFSYSVWVKGLTDVIGTFPTQSAADFAVVTETLFTPTYDTAASFMGSYITVGTDGIIVGEVVDGGTYPVSVYQGAIDFTGWKLITITRNITDKQSLIYIDDTLVHTGTPSINTDYVIPAMRIGSSTANKVYCLIDDLVFYNNQLDLAAVGTIFNSASPANILDSNISRVYALNDDEIIHRLWLECTGLSFNETIYVGFDFVYTESTDTATVRLASCTDIISDTWDSQQGMSPEIYLSLHTEDNDLHIVNTNERVVLVNRIIDPADLTMPQANLQTAYIGFFQGYGYNSVYPYPVCVSGNSTTRVRWSSTQTIGLYGTNIKIYTPINSWDTPYCFTGVTDIARPTIYGRYFSSNIMLRDDVDQAVNTVPSTVNTYGELTGVVRVNNRLNNIHMFDILTDDTKQYLVTTEGVGSNSLKYYGIELV